MSATSVGRNDPCPCGSGKKFKHCCLGKENGASPNQGAISASEALRNALEDQQFSSLEEAQVFVTRHTQQQNQRPREEFHGLSSEQMHRLLNQPFDSPELVRFPELLDTQPTAPILRLFGLLTEAIGEQGLKPTAKGNLPRNFCRAAALTYWGKDTYQERTRFGNINREDDFYDLHTTRLVAQLAGLIRKHKGKFILSRDCRRLLAEGGLAAAYPRLFRAYVEQFNWAYRDGHVELPFIQHAFLFSLYLLTRYGDASRSQAFYEDAFLQAFPIVLDDIPPSPTYTPEEELRRCYTWRTLVDFTGFFGLAEVETISDELLCRDYRVKSLPLLGQTVQFQFPKSKLMV
ncbi:YecA family protein [Pseudomaricurvus alcaniphilus]|uniref:YecA family protein n=1 Tax=Pseudomaricurvus alcaniphilus TaxID=1166482 RepID=UPI001A9F0C21|nr:SEC-C metal-binding domain-containing protein [Pseudomaricurvus alcaniphilus]